MYRLKAEDAAPETADLHSPAPSEQMAGPSLTLGTQLVLPHAACLPSCLRRRLGA